ncbi:MAG: hypothetical protein ACRYFU_24200 [Janthinobacterium lividum]
MPGQQRYLLEETTAAAGKGAAFEAAQQEYCAVVRRGGALACLLFLPTTFSTSGEYLTLLQFGSFGHYDEGTYTSKGQTPEQAADLRKRREPTIAANREAALSLHPKVSYLSPEPGALMQVIDVTIRPGTLPTLLRYVRSVELPQAHSAGLLSSELYQLVVGAATNRFLLLRRMRKFGDLDRLAPFGDLPGAAGSPSILDCVVTSRTTIMRIPPEAATGK